MTEAAQVLLVDDDACDQELFRRAASGLSGTVEVATARDGVEALNFLANAPDERLPMLIIVDYKMPRMDGVTLLKELRQAERYRHLPVVVLTSSTDSRDMDCSYSAGADAFMVKPIRFVEFRDQILALLRFWLNWTSVVMSRSIDS